MSVEMSISKKIVSSEGVTPERNFLAIGYISKLLFSGMALGVLAITIGFFLSPQRVWANILLNNVYFLSLAVGGMVWIAINYVSNAGWGIVVRRIKEAMTAFLPVSAVTMFLLFFGMNSLYEWTHESAVAASEVLQAKQIYLNIPFFFARMFVFLLLWTVLSRAIVKNSLAQDATGSIELTRKNVRLSVIFLLIFAPTFILSSFDWIMSLEPEWYSTIFGFYNIAGLLLNSIAVITLIVILLRRYGVLPHVNENHLHDLGKLLFAFSVFWAYIWFSQLMIIWYANIAEEVAYFVKRHEDGWYIPFYFTVLLKWFIPFLALISRSAKRNEKRLFQICIVVIIGHWLDMYTMILPVFEKTPSFGFYEILIFVGYASLFAFILLRKLGKNPLIPSKDPLLEESIHLRN